MKRFIEITLGTGEVVQLEVTIVSADSESVPSFNLFGYEQDIRICELFTAGGERS